jgi:hypothetical protein
MNSSSSGLFVEIAEARKVIHSREHLPHRRNKYKGKKAHAFLFLLEFSANTVIMAISLYSLS